MTKKGYKQTPEHIRRVRESRAKTNVDYSFTQTPEYREKMRVALSGEKNPRFGVHLSPETKAKISRSEKGKKVVVTEQHRLNMSKAKRGKFVGEKNWNWKGGRKNCRLRSPLLYAVRNCLKYREWKQSVLKDAFPNGRPEGLEEIQVHHRVGLFKLIKQNNITTLEEALNCPALWDKENAVLLTKSEHFIVSVLERRSVPSKGFVSALKNWVSDGNFKVVPIGEMIGSPYEEKVSYKELVPTETN